MNRPLLRISLPVALSWALVAAGATELQSQDPVTSGIAISVVPQVGISLLNSPTSHSGTILAALSLEMRRDAPISLFVTGATEAYPNLPVTCPSTPEDCQHPFLIRTSFEGGLTYRSAGRGAVTPFIGGGGGVTAWERNAEDAGMTPSAVLTAGADVQLPAAWGIRLAWTRRIMLSGAGGGPFPRIDVFSLGASIPLISPNAGSM